MTNWSEEKREAVKIRTQKWVNDFMEDPFFKELTEEQQDHAGFAVDVFANYMYDYEKQMPEEWTVESLMSCCTEILPRKISSDEDFFEELPHILEAYFLFLDKKGYIKNGKELAKVVLEIADEIAEEGSNPDNWGMAKTFMMAAIEAGIDPTDSVEVNKFISVYNNKMQASNYLMEEVVERGRDIDRVMNELPHSQWIDILPNMLGEEEMEKYLDEDFFQKTLDTFFEGTEKGLDVEVIMKDFSPAQQAIVLGFIKDQLHEEGHNVDEIMEVRPKGRGRIVSLRTTPKVGRNAPCPCGSGKKYKRCCGK
ncbi:MAG: SEC-C metal-binding domain-containing protein [Chitinophagales bacterium]